MGTHITDIRGKIKLASVAPSNPVAGDEYFDTAQMSWMVYSGNNWLGTGQFTTTSTSSTTSTSTSTSTTTTTTSTSTSTTTSTSTSTTTTG
jgi:hypothetical protein